MGTRGLTVVYKDGEHKIAQYGQWDHYPSGQGITALDFLRSSDLPALEANLDRVQWITDEHYEAATKHITGGKQWITQGEVNAIDTLFPLISRDHGAEILFKVAHAEGDIWLRDGLDFVADSLFNEYTYVIDLDNRVFEVYEGFQTEPHSDGRYAHLGEKKGYYPVRLVKTYSLDDLPSDGGFIADLEPEEEN